jgi:hypothetical protein
VSSAPRRVHARVCTRNTRTQLACAPRSREKSACDEDVDDHGGGKRVGAAPLLLLRGERRARASSWRRSRRAP